MLRVMDSVAANNDSVGDFMPDVDRTLLRENLKLSFEQRARKHLRVLQMVEELRRAGKSCDRKVMAVDLAQVIPPLVRAKVDLTPSTSKLSPSVSNAIDLPTLILIKEAAGRQRITKRSLNCGSVGNNRERSSPKRAQVFSATRVCSPARLFPFPRACPTH